MFCFFVHLFPTSWNCIFSGKTVSLKELLKEDGKSLQQCCKERKFFKKFCLFLTIHKLGKQKHWARTEINKQTAQKNNHENPLKFTRRRF
jgi:hypothetical protein